MIKSFGTRSFWQKKNQQRGRQTKQETWDVSVTQPGAYLCMFVRPNGVHILFYNDRRMIPMYSGTFGYIQKNPWSIRLCLLFKKNDKWEYFICNEFLTPPVAVTKASFGWVCAAGLSEQLPLYSLFCGHIKD